jgi:hypothetical protein
METADAEAAKDLRVSAPVGNPAYAPVTHSGGSPPVLKHPKTLAGGRNERASQQGISPARKPLTARLIRSYGFYKRVRKTALSTARFWAKGGHSDILSARASVF